MIWNIIHSVKHSYIKTRVIIGRRWSKIRDTPLPSTSEESSNIVVLLVPENDLFTDNLLTYLLTVEKSTISETNSTENQIEEVVTSKDLTRNPSQVT